MKQSFEITLKKLGKERNMSTPLTSLGAYGLPESPAPPSDFTTAATFSCDHAKNDPVHGLEAANVIIISDPFSEPILPMLPVWLRSPVKMTRQEYADRLVESIW